MKILRIICWIKSIFRTLLHSRNFLPTSGCEFEEQDDGSLKCEICGKVSE